MAYVSDYWKRGIGGPGIVTINSYTSLAIDSPLRTALAALDDAIRNVRSIAGSERMIAVIGVALVNTRMVDTGQLFEIDADGMVVESQIVVPELREMLYAFMDK